MIGCFVSNWTEHLWYNFSIPDVRSFLFNQKQPSYHYITQTQQTENHIFPVQVMNLSDLAKPRTGLGFLTHVDSVKSDKVCEVQFKRISADTEEVSVDKHPAMSTDT